VAGCRDVRESSAAITPSTGELHFRVSLLGMLYTVEWVDIRTTVGQQQERDLLVFMKKNMKNNAV
jgi:hypothetical protein